MKYFKSEDFKPTSFTINKEELNKLLDTPKQKVFLCWHDWVYWKFGIATKLHRVCKKCFNKQQDRQIIPKYRSTWIKEIHFK